MKKQSVGKTSKLGRQHSAEATVIEGGFSDLSTLQRVGPVSNAPLLHTTPSSRDLRSRTDERLRRASTEPGADRLFSELGSAVGRYLQAVSEVRGYRFLSDYQAGLTVDSQHLAMDISTPVRAILVNPLHESHGKFSKSTKITKNILDAVTQEAVKAKLGSSITDDKFTHELAQLGDALHQNGAYARIFDEVKMVLGRHWEVYTVARGIYADIGLHDRINSENHSRAERQKIAAASREKGRQLSLAKYYKLKSQRDERRKLAASTNKINIKSGHGHEGR